MEITSFVTWAAALAVGALAIAALVRTFEAVFDLDLS
jgi:hypothetical protein